MAKKNFLLLSLDDEKAKKVANVMSNKSCSKILEFLTENEATETEIAEKLNIPISTVHYNLQQLLDAKLIIWEKYHYSEKGKEVRHYTVANKYIIIAPKGDKSNFIEQLKNIIPTILFTGIGALFVYYITNFRYSLETTAGNVMMTKDVAIQESAEMVAYNAVAERGMDIAQQSVFTTLYNSPVFWFVIGALFSIIVYFIIVKIRKILKK